MNLNQYWFKMTALLFVALMIATLASVPIKDAGASFFRQGDFQMALTIGQRFYFTDETIKIGMRLQNVSKQVQLVRFNGGCQATYQIYNSKNEMVFPRFTEETPCNNSGYEEFLIAPGQAKRYYFEIINAEPFKAPVVPEGKYKIVGIFQGFGNIDPLPFEIKDRPDFRAKEGELCSGLTGLSCSAGLVCKHEGGFTDGAGMCMKEFGSFEPKNICSSGLNNCISDVHNHPARDVIEKFVRYNRVSGFEDRSFKPDNFIAVSDFSKLVSTISNHRVTIETTDPFVRRDTSVAVLYKVYINQAEPRTLGESPFGDINESPHRNFIVKSHSLGLLKSSTKFRPAENLTRAEALILIDRFENY